MLLPVINTFLCIYRFCIFRRHIYLGGRIGPQKVLRVGPSGPQICCCGKVRYLRSQVFDPQATTFAGSKLHYNAESP
jgi:hypothetical protein